MKMFATFSSNSQNLFPPVDNFFQTKQYSLQQIKFIKSDESSMYYYGIQNLRTIRFDDGIIIISCNTNYFCQPTMESLTLD